MRVLATALSGVKIIEPTVFGDERGFFFETWNKRTYEEAGIHASFVQDNHSRSARGVLRGLHYQVKQPQGKLMRVVAGRVYDVAVDVRRSSPEFGRWVAVELSADNKRMLWVPPGYAHGFLSLEDGSEFVYKCTDFYAPEHERTVLWRDPDIGIDWPLDGIGQPLVAAKDAAGELLAAAEIYE